MARPLRIELPGAFYHVINPAGTIIAHRGDPKLVGRDFTGVQDIDGKYFEREFIKIGWVDYKWMNL